MNCICWKFRWLGCLLEVVELDKNKNIICKEIFEVWLRFFFKSEIIKMKGKKIGRLSVDFICGFEG